MSAERNIWRGMMARCCNPKHDAYHNYGGRGIRVCRRWKRFESFLEDMGKRPAGMTLDRIDNDRGYSRDNCRWTSWKIQANNRRGLRLITVDGVTRTQQEWSELTGIGGTTIGYRLAAGWSASDAVSVRPPTKDRFGVVIRGRFFRSAREAGRELGVSGQTILAWCKGAPNHAKRPDCRMCKKGETL